MRDEDGMDGACSRDATLMHHLSPTKEGKMGLAQWERERENSQTLFGRDARVYINALLC